MLIQSLALERVLEKVAAGEGEEAGMKAQELSALCLRQMKLLMEKNEIEKAVAIMNMSLMQAAYSSEQRKMAESINLRRLEIIALDCEKEELEAAEDRTASYVLKVQAEQQDLQARNHNLLCQNDHLNRENHMMRGTLCAKDMELMHLARAVAQLQGGSATLTTEIVKLQLECVTVRSELGMLETEHQKQVACSNFDSDMMRRLRTTFSGYLKAALAFSKYLHKILAEAQGGDDSVEQLLKDFEIRTFAPTAFLDSCSTNIWEHWISSKMFKGFETRLFGMEHKVLAPAPVDAEQHRSKCYQMVGWYAEKSPKNLYEVNYAFQDFCIKKYLKVLPQWLVERLTQLADVNRDKNGSFESDRYYHSKFLDVAKEAWLLHKLAFSFHSPATILRVCGFPGFESLHHEALNLEP